MISATVDLHFGRRLRDGDQQTLELLHGFRCVLCDEELGVG
jgi:hypothetical protein